MEMPMGEGMKRMGGGPELMAAGRGGAGGDGGI